MYYHPRTDHSELEKYHEGIICCSACLGGEVPQLIMRGQMNQARETIKWFKGVFGDDYYLELQRHKATVAHANHETYEKQCLVNDALIQFARELDIKLICTNDSHFVNEEDADAHERLICVSTGKKLTDENVMLYSKQEWFKTQEEMNEVFADVPEALQATSEILDKVEIYSIDHSPILPDFPLPEGFKDEDEYLRYLVYEGAKERWPELTDEQRERSTLSWRPSRTWVSRDTSSLCRTTSGWHPNWAAPWGRAVARQLARPWPIAWASPRLTR